MGTSTYLFQLLSNKRFSLIIMLPFILLCKCTWSLVWMDINYKCNLIMLTKLIKLWKLNHKKTNNPIEKQWAKDLHKHLTKEAIQMANKHVQRRSTLYGIREIQIKQDAATHLLEWPKPRTNWQHHGCWKAVEQPELSHIAGGNAKVYSHFGSQLGCLV